MQFKPFEHVDQLATVHAEGDDIDQKVLSPTEVRLLLDNADTVKRSGDGALMRIDYRLILETAVTLGMRQSELLGLRWADVDWASRKLYVRRSLREGAFYDTKSRNSRRIVEVPAALLTKLKAWRLACPKGEHELVFPNRDGQPLDAPKLINRGLKSALRRAGLREIRFHDLRHTCASLLLSAGSTLQP